MDKLTNVQKDRWTNRWACQMDRQMCRKTDWHTGGQNDNVQIDRCTNRWTYQMDRHMDRQLDR